MLGGDFAGTAELFSWWTGGGEAAGLEAMIGVFEEYYPNVEVVNAAVAGGAGTNARAVLATRLQAGDPPGSWQGHAGQELIGTYVAAGQLEPLNFLYEEMGWLDRHAGNADSADVARWQHLLCAGQHPSRQRALVQPDHAG